MALTEKTALERLRKLTSAEVEPVLSETDLRRLLDDHARAAVWTAATAYAVNALIVTTDRNGRLFRCIQAGTSDTTEPEWSTCPRLGDEVADGDDLIWRDEGPAFGELYDLNASARAGWLEKAAASFDYTFVGDRGETLSRQQIHDHCVAMANRFEPVYCF